MASENEERVVTEIEVIAGEDGGYYATINGGSKYEITPSEYERIRDNFRTNTKSHLDMREVIEVTAENRKKSKSVVGSLTVDVSEALTGLKAVQREAKKATQALRELEEAERKASEGRTNMDTRKRYVDLIKRYTDDTYVPMPFNYTLYDAVTSNQRVTTLWTDRLSGSTTSAIAAAGTFDNVVFVVESEIIARDLRFTHNIGKDKVVSLDEIQLGAELVRNNDVFIFDDVSDRNEQIAQFQLVSDKKIIKIRQSDTHE